MRSSCSKLQPAPGLLFFFFYFAEVLHFGCKGHNQSDFGVDHMVMPMCRVISWVVGKGSFLWPACTLKETLLSCALLHSVLQSQMCLLLQLSLDFWLFHSIPYDEKGIIFFWCSGRSCTFSFFGISGSGIDLDYCDVEWFAFVTNWDHSVIFEQTKHRIWTHLLTIRATPFLL